jgi:hypothetical protein
VVLCIIAYSSLLFFFLNYSRYISGYSFPDNATIISVELGDGNCEVINSTQTAIYCQANAGTGSLALVVSYDGLFSNTLTFSYAGNLDIHFNLHSFIAFKARQL